MKATFSLPDDLFNELQARAEQRGEPRSALVAEALRLYFTRLHQSRMTEELRLAYDDVSADQEARDWSAANKRAMRRRIDAGEWEW